jgi:hypothetical protein
LAEAHIEPLLSGAFASTFAKGLPDRDDARVLKKRALFSHLQWEVAGLKSLEIPILAVDPSRGDLH